MDPVDRLLSTSPPELADPRQAQAVIDLLGTQWRNVVLLLVYFAVLAGVAVLALGWVSRGYTQWRGVTVVGWAVVGLPALGAVLALWRLAVEEGPRWHYPRTASEYAALKPVRGTVTGLGMPVALGAPLASRQVQWETVNPGAQGASPYLPMRLAQYASVGAGVWVAVDPTGKLPPLFVGLWR